MTVEEKVFAKLRALPEAKQLEVLDFTEFLENRERKPTPLKSIVGLCADMGIHISAEEIDEARREMWGNFPREI